VAPAVAALGLTLLPIRAHALETFSTHDAQVTDRIYVEIKGLRSSAEPRRIVIGLFGKDSPDSAFKLKSLATQQGLTASCRPKAERLLQKEQLEANKVFNSCKENEKQGVSLQYSTIWRVIKNERIDLGAVAGKFVARDYPDWQETNGSALKHDAPGLVSVRRGNEGGFGFTIYPGDGVDAGYLDQEHIVVGQVIEGMDVVQELNEIPVIATSKLNYMALTGGATTKSAPTRACRYGGPMYCNENKPLVKLSIVKTGIA
jgi:cyclophilin family peptidyl-prolyl cis-trans isomerase